MVRFARRSDHRAHVHRRGESRWRLIRRLDDLRAVPATLAVSRRAYTHGLLPWKDRTIGWLDEEFILYSIEKGLA